MSYISPIGDAMAISDAYPNLANIRNDNMYDGWENTKLGESYKTAFIVSQMFNIYNNFAKAISYTKHKNNKGELDAGKKFMELVHSMLMITGIDSMDRGLKTITNTNFGSKKFKHLNKLKRETRKLFT
jgi:hypothetical protein